MLEEREAPEARRAGVVCRGVLSSSGQNAMVQDKDQGRFSSCPAVPQSPHKTVTVKSIVFILCKSCWNGGPEHGRGCMVSSDGAKHTPKVISEMKGVHGARKVGSRAFEITCVTIQLSHCSPTSLSLRVLLPAQLSGKHGWRSKVILVSSWA